MRYSIITTLSALLLLSACRPSSPAQDKPSAESSTSVKKQNIIRKHVNIPSNFSYITNLGCIDIIYTQGDYSIEVEGDSTTLNYLDTTFDSNLLVVSLQTDRNTDANVYGHTSNVKMYVSCPDLQCVSICGNGGFESPSTWRTENLQLGVLGSGKLKTGKIECTTFSLQSSQTGSIDIGELHAEDASLYSMSDANINMNVYVNDLTILNEGKQHLHLTGKATSTHIKNPNDPNLINEID